MDEKGFYITTAIDYVNAEPHIGHAYEKILADGIARYQRLKGRKVRYTTGTDEHGQKVAEAAERRGVPPKQHVDEVVERFRTAWKMLEVSHDDFIRTTETRHERSVTELFRRIDANGDLFRGTYKGWYCKYEENFWPESKLLPGKLCPECGRSVDEVEEENLFFRLSRYTEPLLKHFRENPDFIIPGTRQPEMLNILEEGLEDLSVSRTTLSWGIPVPGHEGHVLYVWFEALTNYISSAGFPDESGETFRTYWPADVHVIGKDIAKFHTIIWPAMLMSAGLSLPRHVHIHGFVLTPEGKMSKSRGNVLEPADLAARYGADALRYGLLREIPSGQDGAFSEEILANRYTSDLANDLGNLLHRVVSMMARYFGGTIPSPSSSDSSRPEEDEELIALALRTVEEAGEAYDRYAFNQSLEAIWRLVRAANRYVEITSPWKLEGERREVVMHNLAEALRIISVLVSPVLPRAATGIRAQLGYGAPMRWDELSSWSTVLAGKTVEKGQPLFPRLET